VREVENPLNILWKVCEKWKVKIS